MNGYKLWRVLAQSFVLRAPKQMLLLAPLCAAACGGGGGSNPPPAPLTISLQSSTVIAPQDGTQSSVGVTVGGVTALGNFTSATLLTIDAHTDLNAGPAAAAVTPSGKMTLTLGGYGVAFLTLKH